MIFHILLTPPIVTPYVYPTGANDIYEVPRYADSGNEVLFDIVLSASLH